MTEQWVAIPNEHDSCFDICVELKDGFEYICKVTDKDKAQLIAAAPNLLEVLQAMRIETCDSCSGVGIPYHRTGDACSECGGTGKIVIASDPYGIIDAIAKATQEPTHA